ncbi:MULTISPECIES: hypothetical protein [unclassified Chelatococcus]|uniref:hypothetical protein n=1 Tax=unclassified Chelatococcus TaxID=2638111 RepID=UPI001BCC0D8A|nr:MULTISPECIES: hypothetical protein [unclassified Chelatococcus]MBS7701599.1 hypothetical protein [Chelatococcus sp. YT9]
MTSAASVDVSEEYEVALDLAETSPDLDEDDFIATPQAMGIGLMITAAHERGLRLGLLELSDRVRSGADLRDVFRQTFRSPPPGARRRGIARLFVSKAYDYDWFRDRAFWRDYLANLANCRFNRFSLVFGLGYDYGHDEGVTDTYLGFIYPFLFDVPGFDVRVDGLSSEERDDNLATLQFIAEEAARHGLTFQLSLWQQAANFPNSPDASHMVTGITDENRADYCAVAIQRLLGLCPKINALTLRVHYEGGVPDGQRKAFWSRFADGIRGCGRPIEVDIHSKGADRETLAVFAGAGLPIVVSTKFSGEHLALPYHAASVREHERVPGVGSGLMAVTKGSRNFTRYSYGDFLAEGRDYDVVHRIWHGTQRLLLWADPLFAAAYGREATFCGSAGIEIMEPLSFRGRWALERVADRSGYRDGFAGLAPDWRKYELYYRVWGRMLHNPNADAVEFERDVVSIYGPGSAPLGRSIASASRILPLVTSAHAPGAGNKSYWPEIYEDVPYVGGEPTMYDREGPRPVRIGTVSALDPELFSSVADFVDDTLMGRSSWRYGPHEVADWLSGLSEATLDVLTASSVNGAARQLVADARILAGLGAFFAAKLRAATAFEFYLRTGDGRQHADAVDQARQALEAWRCIVAISKETYVDDLIFGAALTMRGNWASREEKIRRHVEELEAFTRDGGYGEALMPPARDFRRAAKVVHRPITFMRGRDLVVEIGFDGEVSVDEVILRYRHVNQSETHRSVAMTRASSNWIATIPAAFTDTAFPIQYYVVASAGGRQWPLPGLGVGLDQRPYFVARQERIP